MEIADFSTKFNINQEVHVTVNQTVNRDLFAREAIGQIPKILTLLDRNPHSPTYGCFDRNFWHYKIIDFPSGMAQEFVWPLTLVYNTNLPDNPYYQKPVIRDWVEAGIFYAAHSAHQDGSCDDYFPFERAAGAAAFSLLACLESYRELELNHYELLKFFERRADWLAHHQESGKLANHQALIILCLALTGKLLETSKWEAAKLRRLEQLLSWQNSEGWFQEYEGCDPGYHTLTISALARLEQLWPDSQLKEPLKKAVEFATYFVHPDGSYGGEYTSRNTYNFFPHGFELVGAWLPEALTINDQFLIGLANNLNPCYADDHIIGHHTWNYLLAWRDFVSDRPNVDAISARALNQSSNKQNQIWFPGAQIMIWRKVIANAENFDKNIPQLDSENSPAPNPENPQLLANVTQDSKINEPINELINEPLPEKLATPEDDTTEQPQDAIGLSNYPDKPAAKSAEGTETTKSKSESVQVNQAENIPENEPHKTAIAELYLAINKGGVFKLFREGKLVASDTQFSLLVSDGKKVKNAVGHLVDNYEYELGENEIIIHGNLGWAKQKLMTPLNLMILRGVMLTVGRFFPNLIRKILQKMLITGKQTAPFKFVRRLQWIDGQLQITDSLSAASWDKVLSAGIGCDQTSIYVVMSRTFQSGQLQPWLDLTAEIKRLSPGESLTVQRIL